MVFSNESTRKQSASILLVYLGVSLLVFFVGRNTWADDTVEISVNILSKYRLSAVNIGGDNGHVGFRIELDYGDLIVNKVRQKQFTTKSHYDTPWHIQFAGKNRMYWGSLAFYPTDSTLQILNTVRIKEYLQGVLAGEFAAAPPEALKAQAVLARTLVYRKLLKGSNKKRYLIGDLTNDQVYIGQVAGKKFDSAVAATENLVITYYGELIEPFWHATCGSRFFTPKQLWHGPKLQYLKSVTRDTVPACRNTTHYEWERTIKRIELAQIIDLAIETGYPKKLDHAVILGRDGRSIAPEYFRLTVNRVQGWNFLKSNDYIIQHIGENVVFKGFGLGHNVGLCQCEAITLSEEGADFKSILHTYFSDIEIEPWSLQYKASM